MRYEHLIQINAAEVPQLPVISRQQLWAALVLRAEDPLQFVPALEGSCIRERTLSPEGFDVLNRTLDFGSFVVHDQATLAKPHALIMDTRAGPTWPASRLTLHIEEPAPNQLFLRFVYESDECESSMSGELDAMAHALRRQAYEAADLDMVVRIRQLVERGVLGGES